jgi:hypothetical protein
MGGAPDHTRFVISHDEFDRQACGSGKGENGIADLSGLR